MKWLRLAALLAVAWWVMCFTHEMGHLIGGWISGGSLASAELRPWRLPHSIFAPDPHPLVTLWCGPLLGILVPLCVAALCQHRYVWFVAYFCLLANGSYLALGWYAGDPWLDTRRLLAAGASPLSIAAFIFLSVGVGYPRFRRACQVELTSDRRVDEDHTSSD